MNQEVKKKWLEALRSGAYKQCEGALRAVIDYDDHTVGYCCLGVLCDLHATATGNTWAEDDEYLGHEGFLPGEVMMWAELVADNPLVMKPDVCEARLSVVNDEGSSFEEIAKLIEDSL